jgi:AcrR family transcriptional regulator
MALVEHAARLLAEEGDGALTLRRVAREVGTSTMAVYTHFGGMDELRREVRQEGFNRLAEHLGKVGETRDPVFDLGMQGWAYCRNAFDNPSLYRVMFMEPLHGLQPIDGWHTFEVLVRGVDAADRAGRFDDGDPIARAQQVWALTHGIVALHLVDLVTVENALDTLWHGAVNLFIGFGDAPAVCRRSMTRARNAITSGSAT